MALASRPVLRSVALGAALATAAGAAAAQSPAVPAASPAAPSAAPAASPAAPSAPAPAASPAAPSAPAPAASPAAPPPAVAARPAAAASATAGGALAGAEPSGDTARDAAPSGAGAQAAALRPRAYGGSGGDDVNFAVPATRRGGFLFGVVLGGQLTGAEGTPLDYDERGDAFRVSTGTTVGTNSALFLGGALTDWFAFKLGYQASAATKGDYELSSSGLLIGVEAWPLFARGGAWRDVGVSLDFGTGVATIENRRDGEEVANAGSYSRVRAGLVWDAVRFWKINLGPAAGFEYSASETYSQSAVWLGLRTVFYGAP